MARSGGEEFLLVCHTSPGDAAQLIADRLLDGWRAQRPLVTFSIGYSVHAQGDTTEITVEHADMALYEANAQAATAPTNTRPSARPNLLTPKPSTTQSRRS